MDTTAYLTGLGWRGKGHSLHKSGRGITKPLALAHKTDVLGIGKKKHDAYADQWWARAFDDTLKGINAQENEATGKTECISLAPKASALHMVQRFGMSSLYGNFVRGETLGGTIKPDEIDVVTPSKVLERKTSNAKRDKVPEVVASSRKPRKGEETIAVKAVTVESSTPGRNPQKLEQGLEDVTEERLKHKKRRKRPETREHKVSDHQKGNVDKATRGNPIGTDYSAKASKSAERKRRDALVIAQPPCLVPEEDGKANDTPEPKRKRKKKKQHTQKEVS